MLLVYDNTCTHLFHFQLLLIQVTLIYDAEEDYIDAVNTLAKLLQSCVGMLVDEKICLTECHLISLENLQK